MDIRVRMVILGLVIGVLAAVIVASQGCGENHPQRRNTHSMVFSPSDAAASAARARA